MTLHSQARFPATPPALFKHLPPDSLLRVRCFDGEPELLGFSTGRLKPKRLLGEITISASHLEVQAGRGEGAWYWCSQRLYTQSERGCK